MEEQIKKSQTLEDVFRNFIRTEHLTATWDKYVKDNKIDLASLLQPTPVSEGEIWDGANNKAIDFIKRQMPTDGITDPNELMEVFADEITELRDLYIKASSLQQSGAVKEISIDAARNSAESYLGKKMSEGLIRGYSLVDVLHYMNDNYKCFKSKQP